MQSKNMDWLIDQNILDRMASAELAGINPTAEQQIEFEARMQARSGAASRVLTVAGAEAKINISGVLTKNPDFLAMLFGGGNTTYGEIIEALAVANSDDAVNQITLAIDSPGGQVAGLFDAIAAMQSTNKPMRAVVSDMAASSAFALASQADEIIATSQAAKFGSVGIVAKIPTHEGVTVLKSTNAPNKEPDVTTEEGKAVVVEHLDELHALFVDAIATGRDIKTSDVNKNFGRGSVMLAAGALERGMIDRIDAPKLAAVKTKTQATAKVTDTKSETRKMTLAEFKAEHPDLFAEAKAEGVAQERDRVTAHLTLGAQANAMEIATTAIKDGKEMTQTLTAEYMSAALSGANIAARQDDDADASGADGTEGGDAGKGSVDEQVADAVVARLGGSVN